MPTSFSRSDTSLESAFKGRLEAFERAWEQHRSGGSVPRWQDHLLPAGQPCPAAFLFWLLATDIDYRVAAGLPALLAEPYFEDDRLRPTAADGDFLVALVRWEYRKRWGQGERARRQQYLERFPQLQQIRDLSPTLVCRSCAGEVILADEDADGMDCPQCGCRITPFSTAPATRSPALDAGRTWDTSFPPQAAPVGVAPSQPPRQLGRYELGEEIAHGGMGAVLLARDPALNRDLAIKVLKPELQHRPDLVRRFVEEAQITAQLPHPGIVPVHELGQDDNGLPYLAMKLVRGQTLAQLLAPRASPAEDLPRFVGIFEQVCQAVAFAHSHRVIHRDLKPANVMVGRFGEVQVMDWGLAKVLGQAPTKEEQAAGEAAASAIRTLRSEAAAGLVGSSTARGATQAGTVLGTPAYSPPEQAAGQVHLLDERCDVFGLGAILCEILTGRPPYVASDTWRLVYMAGLGELDDAFRRLDGCGADGELVLLVKECLAAEIDRRPRDADVVAQRVAAYQRGVQERLRQAEQERAAAQARAVEERKRRRLAIVLAAVVVLLLLAGGGGAWLLQQQRTRQHAAAEKTMQAVEQARALLELGWQTNDLATLKAAQVEANRALEIAHSGAADQAAQDAAAAVQREVQERTTRAENNRTLLDDLLNISAPQETRSYRNDAAGQMMALAQPSEDEQYAAAFRHRWPDLDIDHSDEAAVTARLGDEPQPVVEEVLAGLDGWLLHRRQTHQPRAKWRRLYRLAEQIDQNSRRRQLRAVLAGEWSPPLGIVARLGGMALPWTALSPVEQGERVRQVMELREQVDVAREPPVSVMLLARACHAAGDEAGAERVLRQAVTARPGEVVLLHQLARMLEVRGRPTEALEYYRAARARRPQLGVTLGLALSRVGRGEEGAAVLRDLIDRQPNNPDLHGQLGNVLYLQKKFFEAEAACRKAIALKPDYAEVYSNLGIALHEQKKLPEAEAACRKAVELQPDDAGSHLNLANVLRDQKKETEAEAAYRKAIALDPDFALAYHNLANALFAQKKVAQAEAAYRKAIALQPDYASAYGGLGLTLRDQKKLPEAEAVLRRAIELQPDDAGAYSNLGLTLMDQKKLPEAEAVLRTAIALQGDLAEAHYNLGNALYAQKKVSGAEAAYRKVIALQPDNASAYINLATTLQDQKRFSEAETASRRAMALKPEDPETYIRLGNALLAQRKVPDAEAAFRKATVLKPDHVLAYNNLAVALLEQKKASEAEAVLRKAIAVQPDSPDAYDNLGSALHDQNRVPEAEAAYRKAIALQPDFARAYYNLGGALYAQKKLSEAIGAYRKAIALQPDYAMAYNNLGAVLQDQKKLSEAEEAFRKADELLPDQPFIHNNLRRAQYLVELDRKLTACLDGKDHPASPQEAAALAFHAAYRDRYHAAVRFYTDAFQQEPKIADDLQQQHRFRAACLAALAIAGKGDDSATLDEPARVKLRRQARDWLRADLKAYTALLEKNKAVAAVVAQRLASWRDDTDLAAVRDAAAIGKWPDAERDEWKKLWADVEALRRRCQEK
jgi:tetratricopeptide (TPR) repeat protein